MTCFAFLKAQKTTSHKDGFQVTRNFPESFQLFYFNEMQSKVILLEIFLRPSHSPNVAALESYSEQPSVKTSNISTPRGHSTFKVASSYRVNCHYKSFELVFLCSEIYLKNCRFSSMRGMSAAEEDNTQYIGPVYARLRI